MGRNLHNLSYETKLSMNQGFITPINVIEALPGDKWQQDTTALLRCQPMLAPVMHSVKIDIHHWFVPARLLWNEFEDFITGGPKGISQPVAPTISSGEDGFATGSLADYMGLPTAVPNMTVSALPFRAYNLIYNHWYRDEDLQDEISISLASGVDTTTGTDLLRACWGKDYFTSARTTSQKGDEINIPLSGNAPVSISSNNTAIRMGPPDNPNQIVTAINVNSQAYVGRSGSWATTGNLRFGEETGLEGEADLSEVSAVSINDLRLAVKLQVYAENLLRHGSRYTERLLAGFGVASQDSRLQLPELLGTGRQVIQFSEVLQTAEGSEPVGEMRGHGIAAMKSNKFRRFIPEYGYIISFMIVRPRTAYQQGLNKMWTREVKEDYYQPELEHIGMQGILNKEIYAASASPNAIFGYQDRYDEYRHTFDRVCGELKNTLNFWTMQRIFGSAPALNSDFVTCSGVDRIFATDADQFIVRANHKIKVKRKLSRTGRPMTF